MLRSPVSLAVAAGWLAGIRSLSAPAAAAFRLSRATLPAGRAGRTLSRPAVRWGLAALAVSELAADKLPSAPDRTRAPLLAVRAASGAFTAGVLTPRWRRASRRGDVRRAAVIGAVAAVASSYAHLWLRRAGAARAGVSLGVAGLAEDALAVGLATAVAAA
jgi:uncharacterized membrane protein